MITASRAAIMKRLLKDNSVVQEVGASGATWPCYLASLPEEPDNAVLVLDSTSVKDGRLMSGPVIEHYGVQFIVRSRTYPLGWAKIQQIQALLDTVFRETVTLGSGSAAVEYTLMAVTRTASAIPLGADPTSDQRREIFSLNVTTTIRQVGAEETPLVPGVVGEEIIIDGGNA